MALSQSDIDALDTAIATGERRVTIDGRTVEYQDTDALIRARTHIARVVHQATQSAARIAPRYQRATFND